MPRFSTVVVDHFTNPRNLGEVADADVRAFIGNPVCGDQILLTATVAQGIVHEVKFRAFGCSASLAVASLLTTMLANRALNDIAALDSGHLEELAGGLAPDQRHVAALCADVAVRLAENYRNGVSDDAPITCT